MVFVQMQLLFYHLYCMRVIYLIQTSLPYHSIYMFLGFFGMAVPIDFISHHSSLLMFVLGGMLVIATCLLVGLLFYRR